MNGMDRERENRIYNLQQALAALPPGAWQGYLSIHCADPALVNELLDRQRRVADLERPPAISVAGADHDELAEKLDEVLGTYIRKRQAMLSAWKSPKTR
jgi:hypothetical protein